MKYFDYAATTPVDEDILEVYNKNTREYFAHSGVNKEVVEIESKAKETILNNLKFDPEQYQLVFTSGGSEANNLGIKGTAMNYSEPKHFITSSYEHSSAYESFEWVRAQGHEVTYVLPNSNGVIEPSAVTKEIKDNTVFIEIMHVNNECGAINPIADIAKAIKEVNKEITFMTDSVQGVGKAPILDNENIDMLSLSGHKIYAPKGVGALIKRKDVKLQTLIHGGALEGGLRGGTQSLASQVAFAAAVEKAISCLDDNLSVIKDRRQLLIDELCKDERVSLNVVSDSNVVSLKIDIPVDSLDVVDTLIESGYAISTKSACSAKLNKGSRTLNGIGLSLAEQDQTYRISVSHHSTEEDILGLCSKFKEIMEQYN